MASKIIQKIVFLAEGDAPHGMLPTPEKTITQVFANAREALAHVHTVAGEPVRVWAKPGILYVNMHGQHA